MGIKFKEEDNKVRNRKLGRIVAKANIRRLKWRRKLASIRRRRVTEYIRNTLRKSDSPFLRAHILEEYIQSVAPNIRRVSVSEFSSWMNFLRRLYFEITNFEKVNFIPHSQLDKIFAEWFGPSPSIAEPKPRLEKNDSNNHDAPNLA